MSWREAAAPECRARDGAVELVIEPRARDLGGFTVRRVLPARERRMVGPFIFIDEMGPVTFPPGQGINVRPHPHIGLATVTYLFEGEILHRDSLGYVQAIRPGAVNLMTAGRGIVHSERTDPRLLGEARAMHGMQIWMALPLEREEIEPAFEHFAAETLPALERDGVRGRIVIGAAYGLESPVRGHAHAIFIHADLDADAELALPDGIEELGVYAVAGQVAIGGTELAAGRMGVLARGASARLQARTASRVIVVGGEHLGKRHIWWNFVSSSKDRIEQAKRDWRERKFAPVPGDDERIPLPDEE